jgi:hypothetical protein
MRYFINVVLEGRLIADPEGEEFSEYDKAFAAAIESGRELLADGVHEGRTPTRLSILLTDQTGRVLSTLSLKELTADD